MGEVTMLECDACGLAVRADAKGDSFEWVSLSWPGPPMSGSELHVPYGLEKAMLCSGCRVAAVEAANSALKNRRRKLNAAAYNATEAPRE